MKSREWYSGLGAVQLLYIIPRVSRNFSWNVFGSELITTSVGFGSAQPKHLLNRSVIRFLSQLCIQTDDDDDNDHDGNDDDDES